METTSTSDHNTFNSFNRKLFRLGLDLQNPRWWFEVICIAIIYFVVSWLVFNKIPRKPIPSPVWPGAGVFIGFLLAWGRLRWAGVFLGRLAFNLQSRGFTIFVPPLFASIASVIGAIVTVSLILYFSRTAYPLRRVRNVVICSAFSGTILQILIGIISYSSLMVGVWNDFLKIFLNWWIGDVVGILVFTPLIITWLKSPKDSKIKSWFNWEVITVVGWLTIVEYLAFYRSQPIEYLILPPLLWASFRFGSRYTTLLVMIVSMTASIATSQKFGVFYKPQSPENSVLLLQIFMGVIAITTMLVLAIVAENDQSNLRLQRSNIDLERKVTERTQALQISEANAVQLATKAEAANQAKSVFIANMSHELRSPLNAVLGFSQLMMRAKNLPIDHYENVDIIHRSGNYLLTLINNILDLSKIEAGKTILNVTHCDLYHLLDDLMNMLDIRASNAGLNLIFEKSPDVPRYICIDEIKLRQILINLIGNAIKFTKNGQIYLYVTNVNTNNQTCTLNFKIIDTGVGIASEELSQLFISFSQTQAGREKQEGTGLGLAISRRFVQLMGGDIFVTSELGKGTTFQFDIQVKLGQELTDDKTPTYRILALAPDQPNYRILVVDDKPINCQLIVKLLEPIGFELQTANNGQEAIAVWEEWQPHLIWMDMRMPVMDGYEATKHIKATAAGKSTVIVALTASVLEEEKEIVLATGCDDFVRKPFNEQIIFDTLANHLGVRYLREQIPEQQQAIYQTANDPQELLLTTENFKIMPNVWIMQLYKSALEADKNAVMELVRKIPETEDFLVRSLTQIARNFQFEKLIDLLEPFND